MNFWRILSLALIFLCMNYGWANQISEQEPNSEFEQANACACGDTVVCAELTLPNDVDHFRFWAAVNDSIHLTTYSCDGSETNTFMVLFDDEWNVLATNDNGGPGHFSRISCASPANGFYVCRVMFAGSLIGTLYNLDIDCYEPLEEDYDICATARVVDFFPYYDEGSTIGMSNDIGTAAPDVFYRFVNPVESIFNLRVCTETFDARVQVIEYCGGGFLDDTDDGCFLGADLTVYPLAAGEFYVIVEGTSALEMGFYSIEIGPEFPECPVPQELVIYNVGDQPFLDWVDVPEASYYRVYAANSPAEPYERLDSTFFSYYADPAGFAAAKRMYRVTTVCPWGD